MNKKAFEQFLEDGRSLPEDLDTRRLATLMERLAEDEVPDPGPEYWHHFNARLNGRLPAKSARRPRNWLGWAALPLAALLMLMLYLPQRETEYTLADLSDESLALLSDTPEPLNESEPAFGSLDWSLLLDPGEESLDTESLLEIDPNTLKTMWN